MIPHHEDRDAKLAQCAEMAEEVTKRQLIEALTKINALCSELPKSHTDARLRLTECRYIARGALKI